jgi:hypothetical protein
VKRSLLVLVALLALAAVATSARADDKCAFVEKRADEAASKLRLLKNGKLYVPDALGNFYEAVARVKETPEYYVRRDALETNADSATANKANDGLLATPEAALLEQAAATFHKTEDFKRYARVLSGLMTCRKIEALWDLQKTVVEQRTPALFWALENVPMPKGTAVMKGYVASNMLVYL